MEGCGELEREPGVGQGILAGSLGGEGISRARFGWESKHWPGCLVRTVRTRWAAHPPAKGEVETLCCSKQIVGLCGEGKKNKRNNFWSKCLIPTQLE